MTIHHDKLAYGKLASAMEEVSEEKMSEMLKQLSCVSFSETVKSLDEKVFKYDGVTIKPIENEKEVWYAVAECELLPEQRELVNPAGFSIGRAYLCPEDNVPCVIINESGKMIGFINLSKWFGEGESFSFSYFIDKNFQKRGYGTKAAVLALKILKCADKNMPVKISAESFNTRAHSLYVKIGFKKSDELDGDDFVFIYI